MEKKHEYSQTWIKEGSLEWKANFYAIIPISALIEQRTVVVFGTAESFSYSSIIHIWSILIAKFDCTCILSILNLRLLSIGLWGDVYGIPSYINSVRCLHMDSRGKASQLSSLYINLGTRL